MRWVPRELFSLPLGAVVAIKMATIGIHPEIKVSSNNFCVTVLFELCQYTSFICKLGVLGHVKINVWLK